MLRPMASIAAHQKPTSKTDCVDTWKARGRIPVPTKNGNIMELVIVNLFETTAVNGQALDLLVEARATVVVDDLAETLPTTAEDGA